jgi:hypothetical protein
MSKQVNFAGRTPDAFFPAQAGQPKTKINLKEGITHGYEATEHSDSLGR